MADFNQSPAGQALFTATMPNIPTPLVLGSEQNTGLWSPLYAEAADILFPQYLNDLSDVTISAPAIGQKLQYNGSQWVNVTP